MRVRSWFKRNRQEWAPPPSHGRNLRLVKRVVAIGAVVLGTAGAVALGSVSTARADTECPSGWAANTSGSTSSCSIMFHSTGQEQSFAVPAGVNQLNVTVVGGAGAGSNVLNSGSGGHGAAVSAELPTSTLPAGTSTLYVEVAGNGSGSTGGWNGGGQGASTAGGGISGGGGGASDVRTSSCGTTCGTSTDTTLGSRLLVAGGGGGGGNGGFTNCNGVCGFPNGGNGGAGPASNGSGGYTFDGAGGGSGGATDGLDGGPGGGGGTATAGGSSSAGSGGVAFDPGTNGQSGIGGTGNALYGAGGGGGGYYGGGGGSGGEIDSGGDAGGSGGGGVGSSFVLAGALDASVTPDATGTPLVSVSYALPVQTTTLSLMSSLSPSLPGQEVTFTATVTPAPDSGSVSFSQDGNPISCGSDSQALSNGVATCTITYTSSGTYDITASYSGDDNFAASESSLGQVVNAFSPTLTATANPAAAGVGTALNDSATLAGGGNAGGTLTFALYAPGVSPCQGCNVSPIYSDAVTVTGNGTYSTLVGANPGGYVASAQGTYNWQVDYSGDSNNNAASVPFGNQPVTVGKGDTGLTLSVTSLSQPSALPGGVAITVAGQRTTFTAAISPAPDGGSVTFTDGTATLCSQVAVSSGEASCSTTYAAVGKHSISASYSGDLNYTASSASLTLYVDTDLSHYLHNGVYNLSDVNLSGGYFVGVNLSAVNLANGKFVGANFSYADLNGADLHDGNFSNASFTGANLRGANLSDANLKGATLDDVIWSNTICPDSSNSGKDRGSCLGHL